MSCTQKKLLSIYVLSALFSGGRLFVGAISVLYVLSHGVSIGEFATIKSIQVLVFLLLDIPSGLWIKKVGSRCAVITSFAFATIGSLFYAIASTYTSFILAEFITAISLCLRPAAFADFTMNFLNKNPQLLVEKIFHRNEMYTNIAIVLCGTFGGYLYSLEKTYPYLLGSLVLSIGLYLANKLIAKETIEQSEIQNNSSFIKNSLNVLKNCHLGIATPIFLLFIIQFTIQPLFHYWQPLFYEIDSQISSKTLGLLFMSYSMCTILLNYIFSKLVHYKFFRSLECVLMLLFISSGFYFLTAWTNSELIAFFSFTCLQGLLFTSLTCISAIINKTIDPSNRPIILKAISFFSRIGMLFSFSYIQLYSLLIKHSHIDKEIHQLYFQASITLLSCVIVCIVIHQFQNIISNSKVKYDNN